MILRRSRWLTAAALLFLAAGSFMGAGRLVTCEDPLQKADAIYVLGGTWAQRWLEAVDLYRDGYAPTILLSRGMPDQAEQLLASRGIAVPGSAEVARRVMIDHLGVPAEAVDLLAEPVDNTAQEAEAVRAIALARHWKTIIVITDRASTRRARYAFHRVLKSDVQVVARSSRYDPFAPGRWWSTRQDFRAVFYEVPKLTAYWLGLKG